MRSIGWSVMFVALFGLAACGSDEDDAGPAEEGGACEDRELACFDDIILDLGLEDTVAPGLIENTDAGTHWVTEVDGTAGGVTPTEGNVYGVFTDDGLVKVEIDDETALESHDWDVAFRRYIVRINSGDSGPSCVQAALVPGTDFADLSEVPEDPFYNDDEFYTDDCTLQTDGSGLGGPATALSGYWSYGGCLSMTGNVYLLQLASGRHVKLEVISYYSPAVQQECEDTDSVTPPTGSGSFVVHWAFLD